MLASVRIGAITQATYLYDGFNRLTTRNVSVGAPTGTTRYAWDIFGHIIAEAPYGGTGQREYVWLGDMPLAVFDGTASPATQGFVHVDHLDRPIAMTDAAKAVTWSATYEPFGKVASVTGPASLNLGLPGQWFQLEAGLAYNWNRHYDPSLGRYTRPDPLGFVDGPSVYGYAGQSPAMRVDPSGLDTVVIITDSPIIGGIVRIGSHAAVYVDNGLNGNPMIFDPAGSFPCECRGTDDTISGNGANLSKYINYHIKAGDHVTTYRYRTSASEESRIAAAADQFGGSFPGQMCPGGLCRVEWYRSVRGIGGVLDSGRPWWGAEKYPRREHC